MKVSNDRERSDITDSGRNRRSAPAHTLKPPLARHRDHPGAESQAPLQASLMTVEHALGVPIFYRFPERVRVHPQSWARQLLHYGQQGKGG